MLKTITRTLFAALLFAAAISIAAGKTPSETYLEYHSVLKQSFSDDAIWQYYVSGAREEFEQQFPPQMRGRAFYIMKSAAPGAAKVEKETVQGDMATLELVPVGSSKAVKGEAVLRLENGVWKIEKVVWQVP